MKELSIFIDESGDFGNYDVKSPYFIISMVFHDQKDTLTSFIVSLDSRVSKICNYKLLHCGPLIRKEKPYKSIDLNDRIKLFKFLYLFSSKIPITYKEIIVLKKDCADTSMISTKLNTQLSLFIRENLEFFNAFEIVKIYYDNGQPELSQVIKRSFTSQLFNVEFKTIIPDEYKLQQVADLFCTLVLLKLKFDNHTLSRSELSFFGGRNNLKKNYFKILKSKHF